MLTQSVDILTVVAEKVALICGDYLRTARKLGAVLVQLGVYRVKVLNGVTTLAAGDINKMYQQTAAVDMPQEIMTQARTLGSAFNDARDIGHDERVPLINIHDAEVGEEGGEVVIGYLRMRLADNAQKR
ncbi:putative uncharacterized protein [Firmicutes bacterium CAG:555]|nr:putative uncharacterized protein [Firmicutes bacterium CAG:555]